MPETPQLARPSNNTKDPNRRRRRLLVAAAIAGGAAMVAAVGFTPRPVAVYVAGLLYFLGVYHAYRNGWRDGMAEQRRACREPRRG